MHLPVICAHPLLAYVHPRVKCEHHLGILRHDNFVKTDFVFILESGSKSNFTNQLKYIEIYLMIYFNTQHKFIYKIHLFFCKNENKLDSFAKMKIN